MEERKNNTGLVVLIAALVIIILGLTGFIVYDKALKRDKAEPNITDNNGNVEVEQDKINFEKAILDDNENSTTSLKDVIGEYHYIKKCESVSGPQNTVQYYNTDSSMSLKDDYTFEILDATHCQTSVGYKGTYKISGDSIILTGFEDNFSDVAYLGKLWIFNNNNINSKTKIVVTYSNNKVTFGDIIMSK